MWWAVAAALCGAHLQSLQAPLSEPSSVTRHSSRGFSSQAYQPQCIRVCAFSNTGDTIAEARLILRVIDPDAPPAPKLLQAQTIGVSRLAWSWSAASNDVAQYRISLDAGAGPPSTLRDLIPCTQTTWQACNLKPNTRYCIGVNAVGSTGACSPMVYLSACTKPATPVYGTCACGISCTSGPGSTATSRLPGDPLLFRAANGFGSGPDRAAQYAYVWDKDPAGGNQSVMGTWMSGDLVIKPVADGSYYLHIWACNETWTPSPDCLTLGPYVVRETCAHARTLPAGDTVVLNDKVVSGVFADGIYVQEPDRASGIKVKGASSVAPGTVVSVRGTPGTESGEAVLTGATLLSSATGMPPRPLMMTNKELGGGPAGPQGAVVDSPTQTATGLAPVGMLVRTTGTVTHVCSDYAYIDDGSGLLDGSGCRGVRVSLANVPTPAVGQFAEVTGCCSVTQVDGRPVRYLKPRSLSDVRYSNPLAPLQNTGFESGSLSPWAVVDGVSAQVMSDVPLGMISPRSGTKLLAVTPLNTTFSGAVAQTASLPAGSYHAAVWSRVFHGCPGSAAAASRMGLDPTGGTSVTSPTVAWSPWDVQIESSYSEWREIRTPTVNVTGGRCTVFLQYVQRAAQYQVNCFDDAQLVRD
jgi:hypothetical protein